MDIIFHGMSPDGSIAHETGSDGTFHIRDDGSVSYHAPDGCTVLFAAPSLDLFNDAVVAWQRYRTCIAQADDESAEAICVDQLEDGLERLGLRPNIRSDTEFWPQIAEQTRDGLL